MVATTRRRRLACDTPTLALLLLGREFCKKHYRAGSFERMIIVAFAQVREHNPFTDFFAPDEPSEGETLVSRLLVAADTPRSE
jgi:hypothetical protein